MRLLPNFGVNTFSKKLANEGREMVVVLIKACGTKQGLHGIEVFVLKRYVMKDQR